MKEILKSLVLFLPIKWQIFINFKVRIGYFPHLYKPRSFDEKIQYRKLFDKNPLFVTCSDKYAVRDYVKNKIGEQYLIPLLYVADDITKEDLEKISCDFVAKTTHDSGGIAIVKQTAPVDFDKVVKGLRKSLQHDFGKETTEPWYSKIQPKIIVEKMIKDENGNSPSDYKFHVFNEKNGDCKVILGVDYDRGTQFHTRTYYDENLNILPFSTIYNNEFRTIKNSPHLEQMLALSKKLAVDFTYVRVDLYLTKDRVYFGELTFAQASGFNKFNERKYDFELGSYWNLKGIK